MRILTICRVFSDLVTFSILIQDHSALIVCKEYNTLVICDQLFYPGMKYKTLYAGTLNYLISTCTVLLYFTINNFFN